ncbi:hypothetical protein SDC9_196480 [bioreactor metagenome]|uniref:Uncharacterized protein n=1 Tax=bioreactor metagenome TaxID=1076179 RepID=A0A645IC47_9ZZZZ
MVKFPLSQGYKALQDTKKEITASLKSQIASTAKTFLSNFGDVKPAENINPANKMDFSSLLGVIEKTQGEVSELNFLVRNFLRHPNRPYHRHSVDDLVDIEKARRRLDNLLRSLRETVSCKASVSEDVCKELNEECAWVLEHYLWRLPSQRKEAYEQELHFLLSQLLR